MIVFVAVRAALSGRIGVLVGLVVGTILAVGLILVSPAGDLISQRLDNPHSNEGRGNLGAASVTSAWEGSPLIGFGSTRDVVGNFNSIAGGATDDCPLCSPPPLGTQGQLWLLVFGAGFVGFLLYVAFFGATLRRHIRSRSPDSLAPVCALVTVFVTLPVYDATGIGQYIALISVGILSRDDDLTGWSSLNRTAGKVVRNVGVIVACIGLGGIAGGAIQLARSTDAKATQSVLVPQANLTGTADARPLTLDSEALIATSEPVVDAVRAAVGGSSDTDVRDRISISAEPNSRILTITFAHPDPAQAIEGASVATDAYLAQRRALIDDASDEFSARLDARSQEINDTYNASIASLDFTEPEAANTLGVRIRVAAIGRAVSSQPHRVRRSRGAAGGRPLAPPTVFRSTDDLVVRIASGLAVGGIVGLGLSYLIDRRRHRLGPQPTDRLAPFDVSTIARLSPEAAGDPRSGEMNRAIRSTAAYYPLAAILADPDSEPATDLAGRLDAQIDRTEDRAGRRVLIVAEVSSRYDNVVDLLRSCERSGNEPVGLILIG